MASTALSIVCTPLTMTTTVSGERLSTRGIISRPLMPPICMSLRTRSNSAPASLDSASSAEEAVAQSYSSRRSSQRRLLTSGSSSTTRMFGLPSRCSNIFCSSDAPEFLRRKVYDCGLSVVSLRPPTGAGVTGRAQGRTPAHTTPRRRRSEENISALTLLLHRPCHVFAVTAARGPEGGGGTAFAEASDGAATDTPRGGKGRERDAEAFDTLLRRRADVP